MAEEGNIKNLSGDNEIFDEIKDIVEGEEEDYNEDGDELEEFLNENKLQEHLSLFRDQQIDFETLMILTEPDLKSLGLPLGPFRKLTIALQKRKSEMHVDAEGLDDAAENNDDSQNATKIKEEGSGGDLPALADEGNFRVIDESGDDSDAHSVKSEHAGKSKDSEPFEIDSTHPYKYDLVNFKLADDFKEKVELQEPTTIESKSFELITDERRFKSAIKSLRKEKVIAVNLRNKLETFEKTVYMMQISSQSTDYIIDFTKLGHLMLLLTDIFVNPNILKVFYEARHNIKFLQRHYGLYTLNAYCVHLAAKELKYEASSLYAFINKFVSYFKPSDSEAASKPLKVDVKNNLRKETHYLLHFYYKTRNEAIDAGCYDKIVAFGNTICGGLYLPIEERKPENTFSDFDKFNDAQKLAAKDLCSWRESIAKDRNIDFKTVLTTPALRALCMSLPIKKEEILSIIDTRIGKLYFTKLSNIMKVARKKYFKDPKDETKYDLKPVVTRTQKKSFPRSTQKTNTPNSPEKVTNDLKRKSDTFTRPAIKKGRFHYKGRKNFSPAKAKSPMGSPFNRSPSNYRGGYQASNSAKSYGQSKYPGPQSIWDSQQNQNFSNYGGGAGFKYY